MSDSGGEPESRRTPNIILVLTDDQGFGDLSCHGNPYLETPHLDKFATEGLRFSSFQVSPFCAPTRAALLTGRYPLRTGVTSVTHCKEVMRTTEVTIAEALRMVGYRSACIGKWHNGEQFPHTAIGQGFDEFYGFNGGNYVTYFDPVLMRDTHPEQAHGYITDILTDAAIDFIGRNQSRPFLCYLAYNAPHTPTQVPDKYFDRLKAKGLDDRLAGVYAMCESIDDGFGRLLQALEEMGLRDDTLVMFLSDNGAAEPPGGSRYNAGMRGYKTSVHEGGTRVPLFLQWPAALRQPRVVEQLAAHIDIYPTLLELCGATPPLGPTIDGITLVPWILGDAGITDRSVCIHTNQSVPAQPFPGAVRTQRYRCVCDDATVSVTEGRWQLYDLSVDPGEERDIAGERPDVVAELASVYVGWWAEVRGGYDPPHRIEVGHAVENPVTLHAPQARSTGLRYDHGPGWAWDWLVGWDTLGAQASWAIQVVTPGRYAVDLLCNVEPGDAGALVRVSAAGASIEAVTREFPGEAIVPPNRYEPENAVFYLRTWDRQRVGELALPVGSTTLTVQALTKPGREVMRLDSVVLCRLGDTTDRPQPVA